MSPSTTNGLRAPIVKTVIASPNPDVTLKIVEYNKKAAKDDQGNYPVSQITYIKIEREKTANEVEGLAGILRTSQFREAGRGEIELEEDRGNAMALLLRIVHGTVTQECYSVYYVEIFYLIAVAKKYLYQVEDSKPRTFFSAWWNALKTPAPEKLEEHHGQLMYLTFTFDHAKGFQISTKWLAYNSTYVRPMNPTEHRDLGLPSRVVGAVNGTRGSLQKMLFNGIFSPIEAFHEKTRTCDCKRTVVFDYEDELFDDEIYPLERSLKSNSVTKLLNMLANFSFTPPDEACTSCRSVDPDTKVEETERKTRTAFDGLCLDCMHKAKDYKDCDEFFESFRNDDSDYEHFRVPRCRIQHGGKTRYFSFVATKEPTEGHRLGKRNGRSA